MKLVLAFYMLFSQSQLARHMICESQISCKNGVCIVKWICPYGITYIEPIEVQ